MWTERIIVMKEIKKTTLIGLGSMGSFFAPGLYQTLKDGFRVMAQGERKERLETKGVTINGTNYHFNIVTPETTGDPADLVIIAVKEYDLDTAIRQIKNQVGPETVILSVLNGVDSEERVGAVYGMEHMLYSNMRISINMNEGVAAFDPSTGSVRFGEAKNDAQSERVMAIAKLFERAKINYRVDRDMRRSIWVKFMANVGENMTCALLGIPFGVFRTSDHANAIRRSAMREVMEIANAAGIDLSQKDMAERDEIVKKLPAENKPSTLQDLERKKPIELDLFSGTVIRLGERFGVSTPVNELLYHAISVLTEKECATIKF